MPRKPLGELIIEQGLASSEEVRRLMRRAEQTGGLLGTLAVNEGLLSRRQLKKLLAEQADVEPVPEGFRFNVDLAGLLPVRLAKKYGVVPLKSDRRKLAVGTAEPENVAMLDELAFATGMEIRPYLMLEGELADALDEVYSDAVPSRDAPPPPRTQTRERYAPPPRRTYEPEPGTPPTAGADNAAVSLLAEALELGAHSIHLRLSEGRLEIRFRLGGKLEPGPAAPPRSSRTLLNQIKVLAGMSSAERGGPQQGHFRTNVGGKPIAVAAHFTPTLGGERALLRLEARQGQVPGYEELETPAELVRLLDEAGESRHGLVIFTGPPFSGKKDLIYSLLDRLDLRHRAVITVEGQTSYGLTGVDTLRPLAEEGLSYPGAVDAALFQDPDVLFVDDLPTAEVARRVIGAAYARTLILLRLPSSGIISGLLALRQMSDEPFLFASSLLLAVSQRQLRRLCPQCKRPYSPSKAVLQSLKISATRPFTFYEAPGCAACEHTGSGGTVNIYEQLEPNAQIRQLLAGELSIEELSRAARRTGLRTAREAALDLALKGEVSVAEILRLT